MFKSMLNSFQKGSLDISALDIYNDGTLTVCIRQIARRLEDDDSN